MSYVKKKLSQSQSVGMCLVPGGWFILLLLLLLPTPTIWFSRDYKQNVSDGVISGVRRNGNVLILLTLILSRLRFRLQLRFFNFN